MSAEEMNPEAENMMQKLIDFLNRLEDANMYYKLDKMNDAYIMVEVDVPGERWEVEFSADNVRIERFISEGILHGESEIDALFRDFGD